MKKLSLETLQSRAESVVPNELLTSISGGTENDCHDDYDTGAGGGGSIIRKKPQLITG